MPCAITIRCTARESAPSAMRMPISGVRCWTEYAMSPYTPIAASSSAEPPKIVISHMSKRDRATDSPTTSSIERTRATGRPPLACCSAFWIGALSAYGSVAVRTIHTIGRSRTFSAVTPPGTCAIGTYIAGRGVLVRPVSRTSPTMPMIWRIGS